MADRADALRNMTICRFCLTEEGPFTSIYEKQCKDKQTVPLPLQLMACIAIEVFPNDGMPQLICNPCRSQTLQAYTFKSNCKKADDALKVFLATGSLVKPGNPAVSSDVEKSPQSEKRTVVKTKPTPGPSPKRIKIDNTEIITLNYTDDYFQEAEPSNDEIERDGDAVKSAISADENSREEQVSVEYVEVPDDNINLNPTLTVNQVKTDCFPCPLCERSFPLKQLLDIHKANHDRERNYSCEECEKSFFTKYDLAKHKLTHKDSKPFTCVVCKKSFARESLLHRHEKIHIDVPKYLCSQCDRTFLTSEDLDSHSQKHRKKRPFTCKTCNKSFVFKQGLDRHEATHNNVKPHKCNYCEASFTSPIKLTRHITSHAGLRPYPCKICGRTFLLSHHLTRHMRSHYAAQQSTPFEPTIGQHKCDICSMSFKRKDSLINHSAIHSMVNLKCVICNTEFDNVNSVKAHITTHLTDLPFPCEQCEYSFDSKEQLEDHELKHAEMEYEEQIEQEVIEEARQAAEGKTEDEQSDFSGDDIAEFTITNDMDNPEIIRRKSKRLSSSKVKNYAEFLKDEIDSDTEINENEATEEEEEISNASQEEDIIKPIIRSEGTKVYSRKSPAFQKTKPVVLNAQQVQTPATINHSPLSTIDTITNSPEINKLPPKEIFNVKIGDKTVTVQKLLLTKEQMKAMAKEGKIEKKGNTLLLKKRPGQLLSGVNIDSIIDSPKSSLLTKTPPVTKTYQRKSTSGIESVGTEGSNDSVMNFDESTTNMSIEDAISNI